MLSGHHRSWIPYPIWLTILSPVHAPPRGPQPICIEMKFQRQYYLLCWLDILDSLPHDIYVMQTDNGFMKKSLNTRKVSHKFEQQKTLKFKRKWTLLYLYDHQNYFPTIGCGSYWMKMTGNMTVLRLVDHLISTLRMEVLSKWPALISCKKSCESRTESEEIMKTRKL